MYAVHVEDKMEIEGLTQDDVMKVCRSGAVVDPPKKDIRTGDWKYPITGRIVGSSTVIVVFAF